MTPAATSTMVASTGPAVDVSTRRRAVERGFRLSIHVLAGVASVMLATAEGSAFPTLLTVPVTVAAAILSARKRYLSSVWANALGFFVFFPFAIMEFTFGSAADAKLRGGVHLLVYLTWLVLLQRHTAGKYWYVCALTVLQVAVGTLLVEPQDSGRYGLLLCGYALLAIWTLTVFSVRRAYAKGADAAETATDSGVGVGFDLLRATSSTGTVVTGDDRGRVFGPRFAAGVVSTTFGSMAVAVVVFLLFPRNNLMTDALANGADEFSFGQTTMTGFSESVELGELGRILESNERVLEVRAFDGVSGEELDLYEYANRMGYDEPLFRGKALTKYEDGRWSAGREARRLQYRNTPPRDAVRQEYRLADVGTDILFAVNPVERVLIRERNDPVGAVVEPNTSVVRREASFRGAKGIEYVAYSPRRRGENVVSEPRRMTLRERWYGQLDDLLERPAMPRLQGFVADELAEMRGGRLSPREVAEKFNRYLQSEGGFAYSLEGQRRPVGVDPVENFLFETKTGHCEYYASALTLMLRNVNVPARVVTGFKGGGKNRLTGYFEVEERHAHAWVEAYITEEPIELILRGTRREAVNEGTWVVFDPTPSVERSESVASNARNQGTIGNVRRFVVDQWDRYVLRMNSYKQNTQFYRPVRNFLLTVWRTLQGEAESRRALWNQVKEFAGSPDRWFSPSGFLVTFFLLLLAYGGVRLSLYLFRLVRNLLWPQLAEGAAARQVVVFYERFQQSCERLGLKRGSTQTHGEFAVEVTNRVAEEGLESPLAPVAVVRSFHDVRFGGRSLPPEELRRLDEGIEAFEAAVEEVLARRNPV